MKLFYSTTALLLTLTTGNVPKVSAFDKWFIAPVDPAGSTGFAVIEDLSANDELSGWLFVQVSENRPGDAEGLLFLSGYQDPFASDASAPDLTCEEGGPLTFSTSQVDAYIVCSDNTCGLGGDDLGLPEAETGAVYVRLPFTVEEAFSNGIWTPGDDDCQGTFDLCIRTQWETVTGSYAVSFMDSFLQVNVDLCDKTFETLVGTNDRGVATATSDAADFLTATAFVCSVERDATGDITSIAQGGGPYDVGQDFSVCIQADAAYGDRFVVSNIDAVACRNYEEVEDLPREQRETRQILPTDPYGLTSSPFLEETILTTGTVGILDASYDSDSALAGCNNIFQEDYCYQSFKILSTGLLTSIWLRVFNGSPSQSRGQLDILEGDCATPRTCNDGNQVLLGSSSRGAAPGSRESEYTEFEFGNPIAVVAGQSYTFSVSGVTAYLTYAEFGYADGVSYQETNPDLVADVPFLAYVVPPLQPGAIVAGFTSVANSEFFDNFNSDFEAPPSKIFCAGQVDFKPNTVRDRALRALQDGDEAAPIEKPFEVVIDVATISGTSDIQSIAMAGILAVAAAMVVIA